VYAASIVLWELLAGQRIFGPDPQAHIVLRQMNEPFVAPSKKSGSAPRLLDPIVLRGLARDDKQRFSTASEMADAIEQAARCASTQAVAAWLESVAGPSLEGRAKVVAEIDGESDPESPSLGRTLRGALSAARNLFRG
jgi:serine/threonine-protein kinase